MCRSIASKIGEIMMLNVTQTIAIEEGILICTAFRIQPYRVVNNLLSVNDVFFFL